jgi:hypothetical protein
MDMRLRLALAIALVGIGLATGCGQVTSTPTPANIGDTSAAMPMMTTKQTSTTESELKITVPANIASQNTAGDPVMLRAASDPPLISQQQAMAIIAQQFPWGLAGNWDGNQVTVQSWYGLGSIGQAGARGGWLGPLHIPLSTGQTIDHIENRPMWLLAYSNVPGMIASVCPGCASPPVYTHDVYAVDAQTQSLLWWASYPEP